VLVFLAASLFVAGAESKPAGVELELACPQEVSAGCVLDLKITLRNRTASTIHFEVSSGDFALVDLNAVKDGKDAPLTAFGDSIVHPKVPGGGHIQLCLLKEGESFSQIFRLSRFFDFSLVGTYRIKAARYGVTDAAKKPLELTAETSVKITEPIPDQADTDKAQ
jgi:hypothetical protein